MEDNPEQKIDYADNSASKELGVKYRDFSTTMIEMADKMVELGIVEKPEPEPENPEAQEEAGAQ